LDDYAQELAGAIRLNSAILTNGAPLRPAYIEQIKQRGMRLAIPLDGLGAAHDTQRPLLGGQPSFPQVQRGLDLAAILSATFACAFHPLPNGLSPRLPRPRFRDALPILLPLYSAWRLGHMPRYYLILSTLCLFPAFGRVWGLR
jgi:hypothetical protein